MEMEIDYAGEDGQLYKAAAHGRIQPEDDFRLPLRRHWTLYDSAMNSSYVASRLQTWKEAGRRNVETFLIKMGMVPSVSQKDWRCMHPDKKRDLPDKVDRWAAEFNLPDLK